MGSAAFRRKPLTRRVWPSQVGPGEGPVAVRAEEEERAATALQAAIGTWLSSAATAIMDFAAKAKPAVAKTNTEYKVNDSVARTATVTEQPTATTLEVFRIGLQSSRHCRR